MRVEVLVWIKDKIRGRYLGRHMDHLADSIAKLSQGRENWYIGREGIPVDDSSGEKCVPVIVFEYMDLSISQRVSGQVETRMLVFSRRGSSVQNAAQFHTSGQMRCRLARASERSVTGNAGKVAFTL